MIKQWYLIIDQKQEGPFSLIEMKRDWRITPDTLVWKEGFKKWIPARQVKELEELFKDEPESQPLSQKPQLHPKKEGLDQGPERTLAFQQDPYQLFFWLIILLFLFCYAYYKSSS
jgi:hypothetical protein